MKTYISKSPEETKKIANKFAQEILKNRRPCVISLSGELGSGKTTFVQGFAEGLGIREKIISPTFVLVREHKIPGTTRILYHVDLYRLDTEKDFQGLGLKEILNDPKNIVLIEWAEKIKSLLSKEIFWINFEIAAEGRNIVIRPF